jgi:ribosomal-protein-alanine N-acetyltransferase
MAARVRHATAADVPRVAEIERLSFAADPWSAASFASLVGEPQVLFDVAELAGAVAGYSVVWTAADEAELANVAVAPERRGCGLGGVLLDAAIGAARRRGAAVMYLEVRESNAAARALYASRGFGQVGRRRRYYRSPVEDALVLRAPIGGARDVR